MSGREDQVEFVAVVLDRGPRLGKILGIGQPQLMASFQQSDGRSAKELDAHGSTGLSRPERHPDAIGVGRPSPDDDGAALEVEVVPGETECLADPPTLHEAKSGGRGEARVALGQQSLRFRWGNRASLLRCWLGRLDLARHILSRQTEFDALLEDLDEQRPNIAGP